MDRATIGQQRAQAVQRLLAEATEVRTVCHLGRKLRKDPAEAKRVEDYIRSRIPDTQGRIRLKDILSYSLCKEIAEVFGEQPSKVYIERLPEEQEHATVAQPAPKQAAKKPKNKKQHNKTAVSAPPVPPTEFVAGVGSPTVTIPSLGIKDLVVETTKLLRMQRRFVIQLQVPIPLDKLRKLLEGKL